MTTQQTSSNPKDVLGRRKPDLTAIPPAALIHEALAMMDGAKKYSPYNWREKTVSARVYIAAAQRHLAAYLDGEQNASDSGIHHLGHARASLGILLDAEAQGMLVDDRPKAGSASRLLEQFTQSAAPERLGQMMETAISPRLLAILETPRKRRVYIAGPMRGLPKFNFPAFDEARDLAISLGFDPISPADLDRKSGFHEDSPPTDATTPDITRQFVKRDCEALLSLRSEEGDAIALLPGWEKSTGAPAEAFVAKWLGLQFLNAETMKPFTRHEFRVMDEGLILDALRYVIRPQWVNEL